MRSILDTLAELRMSETGCGSTSIPGQWLRPPDPTVASCAREVGSWRNVAVGLHPGCALRQGWSDATPLALMGGLFDKAPV